MQSLVLDRGQSVQVVLLFLETLFLFLEFRNLLVGIKFNVFDLF